MATVYKHTDEIVAHLPGVVNAVHKEGRKITKRAKVIRGTHFAQGEARIEGNAHGIDYLISLVDKAALSIEFGRSEFTRDDGVRISGHPPLAILRRAAGL